MGQSGQAGNWRMTRVTARNIIIVVIIIIIVIIIITIIIIIIIIIIMTVIQPARKAHVPKGPARWPLRSLGLLLYSRKGEDFLTGQLDFFPLSSF